MPTHVEYSLLMPAVASKYFVATVDDAMDLIALGGHTNSLRQVSLNGLVTKEGYDASLVLASVMQEELETAGYDSEVEPVARAPQGQVQRLARADLPKNPAGTYLLDVVIEKIGLANESNGAEWSPSFKLGWRVMKPSGEIVVPTHVFWHGPFDDAQGRALTRTMCGLPSFNAAVNKPQVLWDCFDRGLREASRALIPVIREQQDLALFGKHTPSTKAASSASAAPTQRASECEKVRRPRDVLDGKCGSSSETR